LTTAYTYGKALDYGSSGLTPFQNNLNLRSNYGPADWDRAHMFTFSHNCRSYRRGHPFSESRCNRAHSRALAIEWDVPVERRPARQPDCGPNALQLPGQHADGEHRRDRTLNNHRSGTDVF